MTFFVRFQQILKRGLAYINYNLRLLSIWIKYYLNLSNNKFPKDLAIAISTAKGYSQFTIHKLIKKLKHYGVPSDRIYVFEGGYDANTVVTFDKINYYHVSNNSFDLTSLISINELKIFNSNEFYWLLLHDTIDILPCFINQINKYKYHCFDVLFLREKYSMNIGIYNSKFIYECRLSLIEMSNNVYTPSGMQKAKIRAVENEDYLKHFAKNIGYMALIEESTEYRYLTKYHNTTRLKEYYFQLGIIKYKANYKYSTHYHIGL